VTEQWLVFDPLTRGSELEARKIPSELEEGVRVARDRLVQKTAESVEWLADSISPSSPSRRRRSGARSGGDASRAHSFRCSALSSARSRNPSYPGRVCSYLPAPADRPPARGLIPETGSPAERPSHSLRRSRPWCSKSWRPRGDGHLLAPDLLGSPRRRREMPHPRTARGCVFRRFLRLHADRAEPAARAECGDIVAITA